MDVRDDNISSVHVVDKINIFRPDRVFKVNKLLILSFFIFFVQIAVNMVRLQITISINVHFLAVCK